MSNKKDNNININEMINRVNRGGKNLQGTEATDILDSFEDELVKPHKKMSTFKKILLIVLLVVGLVVIPTAIIINANIKRYIHTFIDFNLEQLEDSQVKFESGTKISNLKAKEVEGYRFDGWFQDKEYTIRLTNDTRLRDDSTIYGRYIKIYSVTLHFRGEPHTIDVDEGTIMQDAISKFNIDSSIYRCEGVFVDSNYTTEIDNQQTIYEEYVIYGKYIKELDINVYYEGKLNTFRVDEGTNLDDILSQFEIDKDGYIFQGWSKDDTYKNILQTDTELNENTTVYGRHAEILNINVKVIDGEQTAITSNEYDILDDIDEQLGVNYHNSCGWFQNEDLTIIVETIENGMTLYTKMATLDKIQYHKLEDGTYQAHKLNENLTGEIVVPRMYKDTLITDIYFRYCLITKIVLSSSVTTMGDSALADCDNLETIVIPNSVTTIKGYSIAKTPRLKDVILPDSITSIGEQCFNHSGLTSIRLSESLQEIGYTVFHKCDNLKEITIPNSVRSLGRTAFSHCINLEKVVLGDRIESIGNYCFDSCENLLNINIPSSVKNIGDYAFYKCDNLNTLTLSEGITNIGKNAFAYCSSLVNVAIPNSVIVIGVYAFRECTKLESINIPGSLKTVEEYTFYKCENLNTLTLSEGVTTIGKSAFAYCTNLTTITMPDSIQLISVWSFVECSKLENITIPKNVKKIGQYAFFGCDALISAIFKDQTTWYRTSNEDYTNGAKIDVNNIEENVNYLKNSYYLYKKD